MGVTFTIRGIQVTFPFEPYELQKDYMSKVIECLQNESNAVLESPTGTGKTLCLLCASLAWLTTKKAQIQAQRLVGISTEEKPSFQLNDDTDYLQTLQNDLEQKVGNEPKGLMNFFTFPTIIYASRTHSQLYQAMQELRRTSYTHLKAIVIGSREQLCIHPDLVNEENNTKLHMCRLKVHTKSCHFYNRVDTLKDKPEIYNETVLDIEDLVKLGKTHRFCPYFMAKEVKRNADIIFMPYNYLLDPMTRKSLGINLTNNIIILDEAHNIEKICEDSASIQLKSTDVALCMEEVTAVMKAMTEQPIEFDSETPRDFNADELCAIKEIFVELEKVIDTLPVTKSAETNGTTFDGDYIFKIMEQAGIRFDNFATVSVILDKIVQFISTFQEGPLQRKGDSLELFNSLIKIVFLNASPEFKDKIKKCYRVHVTEEESFKKGASNKGWFSKASNTTKTVCKVLNYWCFSPGFGMNMLMDKGVRSLILTSGTLAPLKPLISELDVRISVSLENPHIVKQNQVCIRIVNKGPDGVELNSSYNNRNNPEYLSSLGRTILNLTRIIPDGLLIFFPSYPVMDKCRQHWEEDGLWGSIGSVKTIYVEPKQKVAFNAAMTEFYNRIKDPNCKGAIFMGVCRGKLSEGLDFADRNGRAVMIIGLPYPPFRDPKVVLKRQYLDGCNLIDREYLSGSDWYSLEAIRAVNQAIGRVIRHKDDYGAIILLDSRFTYGKIQSQLSLWLRKQVRLIDNFGEIVRSLREFYRNAETDLPSPKDKPSTSAFSASQTYKKSGNFDFSTSKACSSLNNGVEAPGLVTIHNRSTNNGIPSSLKRKRIVIVPVAKVAPRVVTPETTTQEYISMVKKRLEPDDFKGFLVALTLYRDNSDLDDLINRLDTIFLNKFNLRYIIQGLFPYIKNAHKPKFDAYWERMR